jgi:hypothetical protein
MLLFNVASDIAVVRRPSAGARPGDEGSKKAERYGDEPEGAREREPQGLAAHQDDGDAYSTTAPTQQEIPKRLLTAELSNRRLQSPL